MSSRDLSKMTVVQLREQLRSRGLSVDGTKAVLVERLKGSYAAEDTILNSDTSISKESLEETVLEGAINEDEILGPDTSVKKKEDRIPTTTSEEVPKNDQKTVKDLKVSKTEGILNDTLDAKLKRAQRFGLPLSSEQMKQKRAERFGILSTTSTQNTESVEDKKKKRAERFGIVNEAEKMREILAKRAERFGIYNRAEKSNQMGGVAKASLETLERRAKRFGLCSEEAEMEIKKQKRAERFGLNKS